MENPIKMDDLEENPLFLETPICLSIWVLLHVVICRTREVSLSPIITEVESQPKWKESTLEIHTFSTSMIVGGEVIIVGLKILISRS